MKKIASRVLALVVALSMLLVPTAFATGRNAATLTIGNFELTKGDQTIALPVYLAIGGGVDIEGARGYLTANASTETASALSALAAFENGEIKAYLNGMDYGFSIPLEQIVALLEEQMGMTIEEAMMQAMSSFDEETLSQMTGMMTSAAALENIEIDEEKLLAALGITLTEKGETTAALFDVEAAATEIAFEMPLTTCKAMFDALSSLDPALADYMTNYFATMNETLAASGEEMTIEDALAMISVGVSGSIYDAGETGTLVSMTVSMSVEGETIEMPAEFITLTDEKGSYTLFATIMEADGESVYFEVYSDDYADAGVDYTNLSFSFSVGDTDAEESDVQMSVSVSTQDGAEGSAFGANLYADNYGEAANFGVLYMGAPVESTEEADSYNGMFEIYGEAEGEAFDLIMDTNLTLSNVPEGELLTFSQSINPLEADEETLNQIATDATNALIQGAGVLMQDPAIASIIGSLMG